MYTLTDNMAALATGTPRNAAPQKPNPKMVMAQHADAVVRWLKLKQMYIELRGSSVGANNKPIPHTTHSDVLQLAAAWSNELSKLKADSASQKTEHRRWQQCVDTVKQHADPTRPGAVYSRNEEFWQRCTGRLAIYLESRKAVPSQWTLVKESVVEALEELPEGLGQVTRATAGAAARAGGAVLDALRNPLYVVLAVVGGVMLVPPLVRAVRK